MMFWVLHHPSIQTAIHPFSVCAAANSEVFKLCEEARVPVEKKKWDSLSFDPHSGHNHKMQPQGKELSP